MDLLGDAAVVAAVYVGGRIVWGAMAPRPERRPGYIERVPYRGAGRGRVRLRPTEPTYRDVRRAYRSIRRARGFTGGGWLPRRPRL